MARLLARVCGTAVVATLACLAAALAIVLGPTLFGYEHLVMSSGSMEPALRVGSVVLTRMVDATAIGVGDVITFHPPGSRTVVTHRVVEVSTEAEGRRLLFTKGDANPVRDPEPVVVTGRIARVAWAVPYLGYVIRYARTPAGVLVLAVLPLVGVLVEGRLRRARSSSPTALAPLDCTARTPTRGDAAAPSPPAGAPRPLGQLADVRSR
jgi:signal peptidase